MTANKGAKMLTPHIIDKINATLDRSFDLTEQETPKNDPTS